VRVRAKKGGETIGGKFFKGGQFVTQEALAIQARMDGRQLTSGFKALGAAIRHAAFKNLREAAYAIRMSAVQSIKRKRDKKKASPPGTPPFTHVGYLRRAVWYQATNYRAIIGFDPAIIGMVAATHEHGLREDGRSYPKRPTMEPALRANVDRFHRSWRNSIG